jgi:peptidoglycan/LPS O-acetylase OafA/YrhL
MVFEKQLMRSWWLTLLTSLAFAIVSHYLIERPFLKFKDKYGSPFWRARGLSIVAKHECEATN